MFTQQRTYEDYRYKEFQKQREKDYKKDRSPYIKEYPPETEFKDFIVIWSESDELKKGNWRGKGQAGEVCQVNILDKTTGEKHKSMHGNVFIISTPLMSEPKELPKKKERYMNTKFGNV